MKMHITSSLLFMLLGFSLACVPSLASVTLYDNGPPNGTVDAWTINLGYVVSDTFNTGIGTAITGFSFAAWVVSGDLPVSVAWTISLTENGTPITGGAGTALLSSTLFCTAGQNLGYGICGAGGPYDVRLATASIPNVAVNANTTYWLNLQDAVASNPADPVFWDENSGVGCGGSDGHGANCPSLASENQVGTIPSEDPNIYGIAGGTTPEPSSFLLFGSGILGLAGVLRRKLF